jgi:hypothetical protein
LLPGLPTHFCGNTQLFLALSSILLENSQQFKVAIDYQVLAGNPEPVYILSISWATLLFVLRGEETHSLTD